MTLLAAYKKGQWGKARWVLAAGSRFPIRSEVGESALARGVRSTLLKRSVP